MSEYRFKRGDTVRIWDKKEAVFGISGPYTSEMTRYAGMTTRVSAVTTYGFSLFYKLDIDDGRWHWSDKILTLVNESDVESDFSFVETSVADLEAILGIK